MKQRFLFLTLLSCVGLFSCRSQATTTVFPNNTVKSFAGTLAGKPIHAFLTNIDSAVHGWYTFDSNTQQVIQLKGDRNTTNVPDFILKEYATGIQQGNDTGKAGYSPEWQCTYQGGKITGTKSYMATGGLQKEPILLTETYPEGTYAFNLQGFSHIYDAFPGKDSTPQWSTDYTYPVCTQSGADAEWINQQIKLILNKRTDLSFDSIIHQLVQTGLEDYRAQMQEMAKDSAISTMVFRPSMSYTSSLAIQVNYTNAHYLVLSTEVYDYSGGAHGNYATVYDCYDVLGKKHLTLSNILTTDSTTLQGLLEAQYRIDNHLSATDPLSSLFDQSLPTTKNFYFNNTGIGFLYNPYEAAAYVVGYIDIFLPYTQLKKYLTPEFKQRMHI